MFGRKKSMSKTENEATPPDLTEAAALSPEQIEDLKTRAAKADENWDRLLRTTADFDNFKKRAAREKIDSAQYATASLIQKLLPVLDNFDMALAAAQTATSARKAGTPADEGKLASLQSGVQMVQQQLKNALNETGLEEIDATGKPFDPNFHEAISQQESADQPEGTVLQQLRKGYKIKERLLRAATVIVAKKPAADNS
jgi:molecular chaperone GrpE